MRHNQTGYCGVRDNIDGGLFLTTYSKVTGLAVDPIEKKPLYHFLPGSNVLSFGTAGCNLGCKFCQNWEMSTASVDHIRSQDATPEQIVALALKKRCKSIAYTYNEPTIFAEFVIDTSKLAREHGIKNVMVTNGYITPEARSDVYEFIDAANVDIKSFSETFYHKLTAAHIEPVKTTIEWLVNKTDVWVELTTLIIPGQNDTEDEIEHLVGWIIDKCGNRVPLHFSVFHPAHKMNDIPRTPGESLLLARKIAIESGIRHVYLGNVHDTTGHTTFCPVCKHKLISRGWMNTGRIDLDNGMCSCGEVLDGVWEID